MIMFNSLSQQIYQRYPQATIKVRNWDYDSLEAITRGEVDIGFYRRAKAIPARENWHSVCCRSRLILRCCLAICRGSGCGRSSSCASVDLDTFLRYPHIISICWEQSDTRALDDVLQRNGTQTPYRAEPAARAVVLYGRPAGSHPR